MPPSGACARGRVALPAVEPVSKSHRLGAFKLCFTGLLEGRHRRVTAVLSSFKLASHLKAKVLAVWRVGACYALRRCRQSAGLVEAESLLFPTAVVCFGALAGAPDEAPDGVALGALAGVGFDALAGALAGASGASLAGVALGADADAPAGVGCGAMPGAIPGALAGAVCDAPEGALQGAPARHPAHAGLADEHCHVKTGCSAKPARVAPAMSEKGGFRQESKTNPCRKGSTFQSQ